MAKGFPAGLVTWAVRAVAGSEFKRQVPPIAKLGRGRPGSTTSIRVAGRARPRRDEPGRWRSKARPGGVIEDPAGGRLYVVATPIGNLGDVTLAGPRDPPGGPAHRRRGHPDQPAPAGPLRDRHPAGQLPRPQRGAAAAGAARPPARRSGPGARDRCRHARGERPGRRAGPGLGGGGRPGRADPGAVGGPGGRRRQRRGRVRAGRSRGSCRGAGATVASGWPGSPPTSAVASSTRRPAGSPPRSSTWPPPAGRIDPPPSVASSPSSTRRSSAGRWASWPSGAGRGELTLRGEFALVVGETRSRRGPEAAIGSRGAVARRLAAARARAEVERLVAGGMARGDAARQVAGSTGIPRRQLYGAERRRPIGPAEGRPRSVHRGGASCPAATIVDHERRRARLRDAHPRSALADRPHRRGADARDLGPRGRPRLRAARRRDGRLRRGGDRHPRAGLAGRRGHRADRGEHRAAGRRDPQRDIRQHRRADHRVLRPPGRAHRRGQGVADRLDHRQPAARARGERPRRRAAQRPPDVQPAHRRVERRAPGRRRDRVVHPGDLRAEHRHAPPGHADRGVGDRRDPADRRLRPVAHLPVHEPGRDARRSRAVRGSRWPGLVDRTSVVVLLVPPGCSR